MHWIQRHIIQQLSSHVSRRYIELKPKNVDGNLFMYHMQQLQKDGFVCKVAREYTLSQKGKLFSSRMSLQQGAPLMQPKTVVMLICQNANGEYLLFRWSRQPYSGLVSFPFSKVHFGRMPTETASEALLNKTNLRGNPCYIGDVYIKTLGERGEIADHMLAHIYRVTEVEGMLGGYDGLTGEPFWGVPSNIPNSEHVPGLTDIFTLVESGEAGFLREIDL